MVGVPGTLAKNATKDHTQESAYNQAANKPAHQRFLLSGK